MRRLDKMVIAGLAALLITTSVQAASVNYWITAKDQTTAINAIDIGAVGSFIELDVWYSADVATSGVQTMFGWDTATSRDTAAVALDGKLTGDLAYGINESLWSGPRTNKVGGARGVGSSSTSTAVRPYGVYVALNAPLGTPSAATTGTKMFTVKLTNSGLAAGQSYVTSLWDNAGTSSTFECKLIDSAAASINPGNGAEWKYNLTVTAAPVPEPGSLLALGMGAMGLAGFAIRRRK